MAKSKAKARRAPKKPPPAHARLGVEYVVELDDSRSTLPSTLDKELERLLGRKRSGIEHGAGTRTIAFDYGKADARTIAEVMADAKLVSDFFAARHGDEDYTVVAMTDGAGWDDPVTVLSRTGGLLIQTWDLDTYDQVAEQRGWGPMPDDPFAFMDEFDDDDDDDDGGGSRRNPFW